MTGLTAGGRDELGATCTGVWEHRNAPIDWWYSVIVSAITHRYHPSFDPGLEAAHGIGKQGDPDNGLAQDTGHRLFQLVHASYASDGGTGLQVMVSAVTRLLDYLYLYSISVATG